MKYLSHPVQESCHLIVYVAWVTGGSVGAKESACCQLDVLNGSEKGIDSQEELLKAIDLQCLYVV